jgi:4-hydroxybenzoate polyprenyltransferase
MVAYVAMNAVYSFWLKRVIFLDMFCLCAFFLLRVLAGAVACGASISAPLFLFCALIFLNLALLKRYAESKGRVRIAYTWRHQLRGGNGFFR